jgi:hypothetical protein
MGRSPWGAVVVVAILVVAYAYRLSSSRAADARRVGDATVSGIVTDEQGVPLADVALHLLAPTGARLGITDSAGRFRFRQATPGRTVLLAEKSGFVALYHGQGNRPNSPVGWLDVPARAGDLAVTLRMLRGGSIAGVVADMRQAPLTGIVISAVPVTRDAVDATTLLTVQSAVGIARPPENPHVRTDRDGRYRIDGLREGEYYLIAAAAPDRPSSLDSMRYFPGAVDPGLRTPVRVRAGAQTIADFSVPPLAAVDVNGRVVRTGTSRPMVGTLSMMRTLGGRRMPETSVLAQPTRDGDFTFHVAPGNYVVVATLGRPWAKEGVQADVEYGETLITVSDRGAAPVTVTTTRGATIRGRLRGSAGARSDPAKLRVSAMRADGMGAPLGSAPVRSDGSFELKNVFGRSVLLLSGPPGTWLEAAYQSGRDISESGVAVRPGECLEDVVLVEGGSTPLITGTVVDESGRSVPLAAVVWLPTPPFRSPEWIRRTVRVTRTSVSGHYALGALPAGNYSAIATNDLDLVEDLTQADKVQALGSRGRRVAFDGKSPLVVELRMTQR